MPEIVGTSQIDVDDGAGLTIKQLIGNIASKDDRISIAHINIAKPTSQPWLTIDYDEYLCVLSGRIILQHAGGELQVSAEQAVIIRRGGRFRPTFPEGGTEYIAVCLPSFRPDRCVQEDDSERSKKVSGGLEQLHLNIPEIVGTSKIVVDDGDGLTIKELLGNIASKDDRISIAHVNISEPTSEPWLTIDYDEYLCVLKGCMILQHEGGELQVSAEQAVFIKRGERFRPTFPEGGTEYIAVCLPAFRPDRCLREDDSERSKEVSVGLQTLHLNTVPSDVQSLSTLSSDNTAPSCEAVTGGNSDNLYHMCVKEDWEAAKTKGEAYYPPTFEQDGNYTHATAVAERLIETANHFYQESVGDWICLRMSRSALKRCGIVTKEEPAMPVGETAVGDSWTGWVCPHVYGGIPISVVDAEFPMIRKPLSSGKGSEFISIKYD